MPTLRLRRSISVAKYQKRRHQECESGEEEGERVVEEAMATASRSWTVGRRFEWRDGRTDGRFGYFLRAENASPALLVGSRSFLCTAVTEVFSNSIMTPSATLMTTVLSLMLWTMPWMPPVVTTLSPACIAAMRACLFLALLLLGPDQEEVEHHDQQDHHDDGIAEDAAGPPRSGGFLCEQECESER